MDERQFDDHLTGSDRLVGPLRPLRRSLLFGMPAALLLSGLKAARAAPGRSYEIAADATAADPAHLASMASVPASPNLDHPTLLVAGPADAAPGRWARLLAPRLASALQLADAIHVASTGGRDGVTGANAFEALTTPDGSTAMLVPGSAAIAWLAGDPRVHFDPARWVPALASLSSGVLIGRPGAPADLTGHIIRVAASTITGQELPALLGLSLLGAEPAPVFGLSEPQDALKAFAGRRVDAIFLSGHDVPGRMASLGKAGYTPIFSLGGSDPDALARDPTAADVPTFVERYRNQTGQMPSGDLFNAFRATAAAAQLDVALVLPQLAPPSLIARWRTACESAVSDLGLVAAAKRAQVDAVSAPDCVAALARINADDTTQLRLRRWIAARPDWRRI